MSHLCPSHQHSPVHDVADQASISHSKWKAERIAAKTSITQRQPRMRFVIVLMRSLDLTSTCTISVIRNVVLHIEILRHLGGEKNWETWPLFRTESTTTEHSLLPLIVWRSIVVWCWSWTSLYLLLWWWTLKQHIDNLREHRSFLRRSLWRYWRRIRVLASIKSLLLCISRVICISIHLDIDPSIANFQASRRRGQQFRESYPSNCYTTSRHWCSVCYLTPQVQWLWKRDLVPELQ